MNFGDLIKKRREELSMTQGVLAEGICTQAMISKIERNLLNPSSGMILKISTKLDVPVSYFYGETAPLNPLLKDLEKLIRYNLNKTDYSNLDYLVSTNEDLINKSSDEYFSTFFDWVKGVLLYYRNNNPKEAINTLKKLVNKKSLSNELAIDVLSTLGIIYYEISNYKKANEYFIDALRQYNETISFKKKIKILYNFSLNLESLDEYKRALEVVLEGIELAVSHQSFYMLGYLYFHEAYLLRKFGEDCEAIVAYENASFIFKILGYNKMLTLTQVELKEVKEHEK